MKTIIIDVDSLRFDQLAAYGRDQKITPRINAFSEDSKVFTNAYASGSPSMPSRASLLYGRFPVHHHVETHGTMGQTMNHPYNWSFNVKKDWEGDLSNWWSLPETLFRNGIQTGAVSSASRYPAPWMFNFWSEYHQPKEPNEDLTTFASVEAEEVADIGLQFLEDNSEEEFFLYLQFWDPHMPMQRPEEEVKQFEDMKIPEFPTEEQIESHLEWETKNCASQKEVESREDLKKLYAKYRAELNYLDGEIGRIIDYLKEEGVFEESLIILTADHGEEFGEHGVYQEHWSANEMVQKAPLIIKTPQDTTNEEIDNLVGNVDISATVLDYMELNKPEKWQGRSLKPLIEDESFDWRNFLVMDHGLHTAQRCIREDNWKMIKTLNPGDWEDKLQEIQLFDLDEDPYEQENLALEKPELVEELTQKMKLWVDRRKFNSDPLEKVSEIGPAGYRYIEESFDG